MTHPYAELAVFPARAGMSPSPADDEDEAVRFPRASGDEPLIRSRAS